MYYQLLRGSYQLLETALPSGGIQLDHVFAHAGDPFNELCDSLAKQEARASFYLPWPDIRLPNWRTLLPYLWILFGQEEGAPHFQGTGFCVTPSALPAEQSTMGMSLHKGILRFSFGHHKGRGGVELWCFLQQPFAYVKNKALYFQRNNFTVAHRRSSSSQASCTCGTFPSTCLVSRCPCTPQRPATQSSSRLVANHQPCSQTISGH